MLVLQFQESTHRLSVLNEFLQERTQTPLTQLGVNSHHEMLAFQGTHPFTKRFKSKKKY